MHSSLYAPPIKLTCLHCGFTQPFNYDRKELVRRVGLEIERRIHTGEYAEKLTS